MLSDAQKAKVVFTLYEPQISRLQRELDTVLKGEKKEVMMLLYQMKGTCEEALEHED